MFLCVLIVFVLWLYLSAYYHPVTKMYAGGERLRIKHTLHFTVVRVYGNGECKHTVDGSEILHST